MDSCIDTAWYREREEEEEETAVNQDSSLDTVCVTSNMYMYTTRDGQSNEDIPRTHTRRAHTQTKTHNTVTNIERFDYSSSDVPHTGLLLTLVLSVPVCG